MKNLNFIDPEVVSKQEILANLKKRYNRGSHVVERDEEGRLKELKKPEWLDTPDEAIEWLDSITNEVDLTPDEADVVYSIARSYKPYLLFIPIEQDDSVSFLKRFFRIDLFNDERIQSIPLLFMKIGDKEVFHPDIKGIIEGIRFHCAQNKEFTDAYQAKLAEIRNNNGALQERVAFYINNGIDNVLIRELEQPAFEMLRKYLNGDTISEYSVLDLLFVSRLQTPDGMQIPRWNEENYLCRLLLDYAITGEAGILDKLFSDYTTADVVLIICGHLKWRSDNMPQRPYYNIYNMQRRRDNVPNEEWQKEYAKLERESWENHREKYGKFLEAQLPELFSGDIAQKYSTLLQNHFFRKDQDLSTIFSYGTSDRTQYCAIGFLSHYLTEKIASAINENNHEQILDISRLFDDENKDWIDEIVRNGKLTPISYGYMSIPPAVARNREEEMLQSLISSAMKFFENGDHAEKWQNILRASKSHVFDLEILLISLVKNKKDNNPSLSLEDFVQMYIPLEIFPEILDFSFFQEQNEDVYQNMIQQHPVLSREDALLNRLLPCFAAIAIKNMDEMLAMLNTVRYTEDIHPWATLFLCVLDQLCEQHEKGHGSIALISEIIFTKIISGEINSGKKYCIPIMLDIIKKYPQVQQLVFEHCYTILKELWDTPISTPVSSHQIEAHVPACIIGMHKGPWHGLKPLLIALRKTRMEWVDANLDINWDCRSNSDNNLVLEIMCYRSFFSDSLKSLRQDMADGLSEWLKPLPESKRGNLEKRLAEFTEIEKDREGFDITYTEPDPIWRYAYVRAIADLGAYCLT